MNLLVNIANLRFGGGVTVAQQLLAAWLPMQKGNKVYIVYPEGCGYERFVAYTGVELIPVPAAVHRFPWIKLYFNRLVLPRMVKRLAIDKILSLGNVAFPSGKVPQLVLIQIAWLLYPESEAWKRIDPLSRVVNKLMCNYIARNLRYASAYALQTSIMRNRFISRFGKAPDTVHLLPNAPIVADANDIPLPDFNEPELRLLMLSRYYPYKNFEVLLPLAKILKEEQIPIKIYLTLDENESTAAKSFLDKIKQHGFENQLINLGHIKHQEIQNAFSRVHAAFLPTLIESFSGVYAESLLYGRPVFTSDLDFATGVCREAGIYFKPTDALQIAATLKDALNNRSMLQEKALQARSIAATMEGWPRIAERLEAIVRGM